ncbi:hypothetical protein BLNAU_4583 [Blattamonas nauphoetae]|uniref:Uncharacterized protein n=1 Tax=Blattamonas nauphoetae TaxID=2049346 RepID=A0ABQ9Y9I6_9EUKA|nr:hypothetical protein BLNAU_4583 [Blattamonas nauphoetae]
MYQNTPPPFQPPPVPVRGQGVSLSPPAVGTIPPISNSFFCPAPPPRRTDLLTHQPTIVFSRPPSENHQQGSQSDSPAHRRLSPPHISPQQQTNRGINHTSSRNLPNQNPPPHPPPPPPFPPNPPMSEPAFPPPLPPRLSRHSMKIIQFPRSNYQAPSPDDRQEFEYLRTVSNRFGISSSLPLPTF